MATLYELLDADGSARGDASADTPTSHSMAVGDVFQGNLANPGPRRSARLLAHALLLLSLAAGLIAPAPAQVGTPGAISAPDTPVAPMLVAGNGSLTVSWPAPADNGAPITDYDLCYRPVGATFWIHEAPGTPDSAATTQTITGLVNGTPYEVGLRAGNRVGESPWSDTTTGTPMPVQPAGPTGLTVTRGDGSLTLSWMAPDDGGAPITDYDVRYRAGSSGAWTGEAPGTPDSTATTRELMGLVNGTSYELQARAQNSVGEGAWSDTATGTPAASPDKPTGLTVAPGNGSLTLSWSAPADNGAPITDYDVRYRAGSSGAWTEEAPGTPDSTATARELKGLVNGASYELQAGAEFSWRGRLVGHGDRDAAGAAGQTHRSDGRPGRRPGHAELDRPAKQQYHEVPGPVESRRRFLRRLDGYPGQFGGYDQPRGHRP